jgi:arylsulfatase A-like enzyme
LVTVSSDRKAGGALTAAGLAAGWGLVAGLVESSFSGLSLCTGTALRLRYAGASAGIAAVTSGLGGILVWLLLRVTIRESANRRTNLMRFCAAQSCAILLPIFLNLLYWIHLVHWKDRPAASPAGLTVTSALFAAVAALGYVLTLRMAGWLESFPKHRLEVFRVLGAGGALGTLAAALIAVLGLPNTAASHVEGPFKNVLLISIDSVRADVWNLYTDRYASPELQRFLRGCRRFRNSYTTFSHSLPAHASMLTGRYPAEHGAIMVAIGRQALGSPIDPTVELLPERLKSLDYETMGIMTNAYLDPVYGFLRGFQTYVNSEVPHRIGAFVPFLAWRMSTAGFFLDRLAGHFINHRHPNTRILMEWLRFRDASRPFFAFLHYLDLHVPHDPKPRYLRRFATGRFAKYSGHELKAMVMKGSVSSADMPAVRAQLVSLNLAMLARMDEIITPVLEEAERLPGTLVILTADHGDILFDKANDYGHCLVYEVSARIPLAIRVPGEPGGVGLDSQGLVSLIDILPTVYSFAGIAAPAGLPGRDLLASPSNDARFPRWVYLEGWDYWRNKHDEAIVSGDGKKLIQNGDGSRELYDLTVDPGESSNLVSSRGDLEKELARHFKEITGWTRPAKTELLGVDSLPSDAVEKLRSLGYLQ